MKLMQSGILLMSALFSITSLSTNYKVTKLIASDISFSAKTVDARLINPWGLTFNDGGDLVITNNDSPWLVTSYKQNGTILPGDLYDIQGGTNPTGLETNFDKRDFIFNVVTNGPSGAARLLFATEHGTILAYSFKVDMSATKVVIDRGTSNGSVYKGIALARTSPSGRQNIYATDFHNGVVDRFDSNFNFLGSFTDPAVPSGFNPFNVRNINGLLYVTFALKMPDPSNDDQSGPGNGYVSVFNPDGSVNKSLIISQGALDSPWGLSLAPSNSTLGNNVLLVGNFGDGKINAYNLNTTPATFITALKDASNNDIVIDGLWSIKFAPNNDRNLFFTSGPNEEAAGLVGFISRL